MKKLFDTPRLATVAALSAGMLFAGAGHSQTINTLAGNGTRGFSGDGGPGTSASLNIAADVAVDAAGNAYIADTFNSRIRKIAPDGTITTAAGDGTYGHSGDGGPATAAQIGYVFQLAVDAAGNLFLADGSYVRKIAPNGIIATVAGSGGWPPDGDGGLATQAAISAISIAVDPLGNLYIGEQSQQRVRKIDTAGIIRTVAGNGVAGFSGDGGPATAASLNNPWGISADGSGNLYIADFRNNRVRKVDPAGIISTLAGDGGYTFAGDGGAATAASIAAPMDMTADGRGNVYIADRMNHRIRKVSPGGLISTIAGDGSYAFSGDGGPAINAGMKEPYGVTTDAAGDVYFADAEDFRMRKVSMFTTCSAEGFSGQQLAMCQQICESTRPPVGLNALIRVYVRRYSAEPPCGR
jgi:sugar lactone lactonase YvrE